MIPSCPVTYNVSRTTSNVTSRNYNTNITHEREPRNYRLLLDSQTNLLEGKQIDIIKKYMYKHRSAELERWIKDVDVCVKEVGVLLSSTSKEDQNFGNHVDEQLQRVKFLDEQWGKWEKDIVTQKKPEPEGPPSFQLFGLKSTFDEVVKYIKEDRFSFIRIWGACGIGKTALLREIRINFRHNDRPVAPFGAVISVRLTKEPDFESIHKEIAVQLKADSGRKFEELDAETSSDEISKALSEVTFLILLDDVWDVGHLRKIAIPEPRVRKPGSKIVISTRFKTVSQAGYEDQKEVKMKYLNKSDSSQLFKLFYGGDTATSHKDDEYAEKTVESCAGLPLALKTLGVGNSAGEQKMLSKLKDSLDTFKDDVKACFLFFVLFEDLRDIGQKQLFEYWIGEGLVNAEDTPVFGVTQNERKLASLTRNAEVIVKDLRACCLLEEASDNVHVEMHSIVRKMAFWLAKDGPQASQRLLCCAADVSAKMKGLKRASLVVTGAGINKALEHIPCCQHMVTLLMSVVDKQLTSITLSTSITKHCFSIGKLPSIRVLDMTQLPIEKLPQTFCELKALKYLNLSYTLIKKLPAQLGNLTSLLLLDLTGTSMLKSIPSEAVSTLVSLISLKLADSAYKIVCNPKRKYFGEEELSLKHLEIMTCLDELQLSLQDLNALKRLSECTNLRESTTYLQLFTISFENSNRMLEILGMFKNLNFLSIKTCIFTDAATEEFDKLSICEENRTNIQAPVLPQITIHLNRVPNLKTLVLQDQSQVLKLYISPSRLSRLHISRCTNLITIACLCPLKYLEILEIEDCAEFVELLSLSTASDHQDHTQCLARLKLLKLDCLPKLENISLCYHSLISLEVITIFGCKKLKKFQVMPPQEERKIKIDCEETWWKEFTGTDGVTNPPFVPSFRNVQSN